MTELTDRQRFGSSVLVSAVCTLLFVVTDSVGNIRPPTICTCGLVNLHKVLCLAQAPVALDTERDAEVVRTWMLCESQ